MESNSVGSAYHTGARNWVRRRAPPRPRPPGRRDVPALRARTPRGRARRGTRRAHHRWGGGPVRTAGRGDPKRSRVGRSGTGARCWRGGGPWCVRPVRPAGEKRRTPRSGEVEKDARSLPDAAERRDALQASRPRQAPRARRRGALDALRCTNGLARHGSTRARRPARRPEASPRTRPSSSPRPASCRRARSRAMPRPAGLAAPSPRRRCHVRARAPPSRRRRPPPRTPFRAAGRHLRRHIRPCQLRRRLRRRRPEPRDPRDPRDPRPTTPFASTAPTPRPLPTARRAPIPRRASLARRRHSLCFAEMSAGSGCRPPEAPSSAASPDVQRVRVPGRASPAATDRLPQARRRADGASSATASSNMRPSCRATRARGLGGRGGVGASAADDASPSPPRSPLPPASTAVSSFPPSLGGAFLLSLDPPTSALSSTADAPLPAPRRRGNPVVGTRGVGAVGLPRAAPTPRAAASRAVVRRDGQTRPLIPAVAPGIRARRCHTFRLRTRRAPSVVAAAAVWSRLSAASLRDRGPPRRPPRPASPSWLDEWSHLRPPPSIPLPPVLPPSCFAAFPHRLVPPPPRLPAPPPPRSRRPAAPRFVRVMADLDAAESEALRAAAAAMGEASTTPGSRDDPRCRRSSRAISRRSPRGRPQGLAGSGAEPASGRTRSTCPPMLKRRAGASPATSAAPGTTHYESVAVSASAARDAVDRRLGNGGAAAAAGGRRWRLAESATSVLYLLWRDPSVAPFLVQTWGYLDGLVYPDGKS